jgi:hypothetical protein
MAGLKNMSLVALMCSTLATPVWAASSASSAASDSVGRILGSFSNSLGRSSDSSTGGEKSAAGDYKVIEVAELFDDIVPVATAAATATVAGAESGGTGGTAGVGDRLRLKLQALADDSPAGAFYLYLPRAAVQQGQVAVGHVVSAKARPYGLEFSAATTTQQPFFLVLHDDWYRDLQTRPVSL